MKTRTQNNQICQKGNRDVFYVNKVIVNVLIIVIDQTAPNLSLPFHRHLDALLHGKTKQVPLLRQIC